MLSQERFITMNPSGSLYHLTQRLCRQAGFVPQIAIQCDDPFYIRKYIEMGLGVGFVPMFSWHGQLPDTLVCKKIAGVTRTMYACWDTTRYMNNTVKRFLAVLSQQCAVQ